ncbi:MAG: PP2C family protein-serine/threonine phosphatase, partial [Xanthobacteraceae bacterium]
LWSKNSDVQMTPGNVSEAVNRELCQNNEDRMFVTVFLGLLDTRTGTMAYTNAGHPPPLLLRAGTVERVEATPDMPLGVRSKTAYRTGALTLQPDDALFVVTDGVIEAANLEGGFYTLERLSDDLQAIAHAPAAELVATITDKVHAFAGAAPKADDVTMLALRWRPR